MRLLIAVVAIAGACFASTACTESASGKTKDTPEKHGANAKGEAARGPKEVAPRAATSLPLTATAPAKPPSVLDVPHVPVKGPEDGLVTSSEMEAAKEDKTDKAEEIDYDRALSPEEVHVVRFVLATDVQDREPMGETDTFSTDTDKIFTFVHLENGEGAPYAFRVHWEPADGPPSPYGVKLNVRTSPIFRTWAYTRIRRSPGRYHAVLRTLEGEEIARREFVIEGATATEPLPAP
jgi:hypothetical protein